MSPSTVDGGVYHDSEKGHENAEVLLGMLWWNRANETIRHKDQDPELNTPVDGNSAKYPE